VAYMAKDHHAEVVDLGTIGTRPCDLDKLLRNRPSKATQLVFVDEAGPCGDWLARDLRQQGSDGWVVAPSLMPKTAADRVKTDRRDAVQLARLMRSGALTPVDVPTEEDEAIRHLCRAREEALRDLKAATFRLNAFLLRHDSRSTGQAHGGPAPLRWRSEVSCDTPAPHMVCQEYVRAVTEHAERLQRLVRERRAQAGTWRVSPVVEALQALRGVPFTVAVTTVAELGDLTRFDHPRPLMAYRGLTPAEYSRGARRRQGSLTTAGHAHARRALVEGAWAYRDPANVSRHLPLRLENHPQVIQDISWTAQVRLGQRPRPLRARGKHAHRVVVARAREFAAFMWAMARQVPVTP
jgi:transposase